MHFNFAGIIFCGSAIFAVFAFLNSQLLGALVLKYSRTKYSRMGADSRKPYGTSLLLSCSLCPAF